MRTTPRCFPWPTAPSWAADPFGGGGVCRNNGYGACDQVGVTCVALHMSGCPPGSTSCSSSLWTPMWTQLNCIMAFFFARSICVHRKADRPRCPCWRIPNPTAPGPGSGCTSAALSTTASKLAFWSTAFRATPPPRSWPDEMGTTVCHGLGWGGERDRPLPDLS